MSDDDLRAEIVALRNRLADLESALERPRVSRRGLFAAALAGGAGLVAAQVTSAAPAVAAPGQGVVLGVGNDGGTSITTVTSSPGVNSTPFGVINPNPNGNGIGLLGRLGAATNRFTGQNGQRAGVVGESADQTGVTGFSNTGRGVVGDSQDGIAVYARSTNSTAVYATSQNGTAVEAYGSAGPGVHAWSPWSSGVRADCAAPAGSSGIAGVYATGQNVPGVIASSQLTYGVVAQGALAPLRLVPGATRGAPKASTGNHLRGELFVDAVGALFLCTRDGKPGLWVQVVTQ